MEKNQHHLQKGLSPRHVQFIALAGMIGTGIFKGSSDTVSLAGPSVAVSYLIGGALLFIVMSALGGNGARPPRPQRPKSDPQSVRQPGFFHYWLAVLD